MGTSKKFLVMILTAMVVFASAGLARELNKAQSKNAQAQALIDQAWTALDDEITIPNLDAAIKALEQAIKLDPNNQPALVEAADTYFYRGDIMPKKTDADFAARNKYFTRGHELAVKALALKETAGAHYWVATNLASTYENRNIAFQAAQFPEMYKHMDWIDRHEPKYKFGATARFWAEVTTRVPGAVIKIVGQDPNQIFAQLENAIKSEPRYLLNYPYKAKFYWYMGKKEDAFKVVDQVLKMDPNALASERGLNKYAQKRARDHWREWTGGKEYPKR